MKYNQIFKDFTIANLHQLQQLMDEYLAEYSKTYEEVLRKHAYAVKRNRSLIASAEQFAKEMSKLSEKIKISTDSGEYRTLLHQYHTRKRKQKLGWEKYGGGVILRKEFEINCLEKRIDEGLNIVLSLQKTSGFSSNPERLI